MTIRRAAGIAVAVVTSLILASCSSQSPRASAVTQHLHASWADGYPTIAEMTAHATVVVQGTVTAVTGHGQLTDSGDNISGAAPPSVPYTEFSFAVQTALKGTPSTTITLRQTGGIATNGALATVDDDPLLTVGLHAVLFLRQFGPDQYVIMGGPAGRFPIDSSGNISEMPGGSVVDPPTGTLTTFTQAVAASR